MDASNNGLNLIWAQANDRIIGCDNQIPWHLPEDFAYFKQQTLNQVVLMGRKTWDSLPDKFRPLPQRLNLVVSRNTQLQLSGARVVNSLQQGVDLARQLAPTSKIWVIGGAQLYKQALAMASLVSVTELNLLVNGDAQAPELLPEQWQCVTTADEQQWKTAKNGIEYRMLLWRRRSN